MAEERMVKCIKLGKELPAMHRQPFKGELGAEGALLAGRGQDEPVFGRDDLVLAEEFARQAAIALEGAVPFYHWACRPDGWPRARRRTWCCATPTRRR